MQIQLTGKHIEITDALRGTIEEKSSVIKKRFDKVISLHVTLHVEKESQIAEGTVHISGQDIHAKAQTDDMYKSIDEMIDKLVTQLTKQKEKMIESHR